MHGLLNAMRFQSGIGNNLSSPIRLGLVTSYNPADCTVKVSLQPENEEDPAGSQTGWIPIATSFMGHVGAPNINDQVIVAFQEGSLNSGMVIGKLYSDEDVPPSVPAGEWWITHPSGSFIKIKNNGDVEVNAAQKVSITSPEIDLLHEGAIKKLVTEAFKAIYNAHTHGGGAPPDNPYEMTDAHLTEVVKAE